jgi:hypothetical protein
MNIYVHLWYLAEFFLQWEVFQTIVVEKIKIHILCPITFLWKSHPLWNNVEKYGIARQATDDNTIQRMRCACWIPELQTHSEYTRFIAFLRQQWLPSALQSCVIHKAWWLPLWAEACSWLVTIYCYIINIVVLYGSVSMMNHFNTQRDVLHQCVCIQIGIYSR